MPLKEKIGLLKSWLLYYGNPAGRYRLRKFYSGFIGPGTLCFDVGAHLGNRTAVWLRSGARVVAVEPQPACIRYLRKKFGRHKRFTLFPGALDSRVTEKTLHISSLNPAVSTLSDESWMSRMADAASFRLEWDSTTTVPTTTLDRLIAEHGIPGFCKIDTEGYELQVLQGLSVALPLLCFEVISVQKESVEPCIGHINALGDYEYNWSVAESLRFRLPEWVNAAQVLKAIQQYPSPLFSGDIYARRKS
jgi:FkbM family methyltransferase